MDLLVGEARARVEAGQVLPCRGRLADLLAQLPLRRLERLDAVQLPGGQLEQLLADHLARLAHQPDPLAVQGSITAAPGCSTTSRSTTSPSSWRKLLDAHRADLALKDRLRCRLARMPSESPFQLVRPEVTSRASSALMSASSTPPASAAGRSPVLVERAAHRARPAGPLAR